MAWLSKSLRQAVDAMDGTESAKGELERPVPAMRGLGVWRMRRRSRY